MNSIPIEITKLISLDLRPNYLSLVCKLYDNMYDELWYHEYLSQRYDETEIMGTDFTFRELCERSISEGIIYARNYSNLEHFDTKIAIRGIKSVSTGSQNKHYVLTFNGKVYRCTNNLTTTELIDTNVIDIHTDCYIKKSQLLFSTHDFCDSITFSTTGLIKELENIGGIKFQFYTNTMLFFYDLETKKLNVINIVDGIRKAYTIIRCQKGIKNRYITYILTNKNTVLIYFNKDFTTEAKIITNVTALGKNYICIETIYYFFNPLDDLFEFDYKDLRLIRDTINSSVCIFVSYNILICNNKIMWVQKGAIITRTFNYRIKSIMGDYRMVYIIRN